MIAAFAALATARAAGGDPEPSAYGGSSADPILQSAYEANRAQDFPRAAGILKDAIAKTPGKADYHNLYAFALRKSPNPDMKLVFQHYQEALRLDPEHRRAHEYIGEAYLMSGNLAKAKEHLKVLDRLCFFPCDEYSMLKASVQAYEARQKR